MNPEQKGPFISAAEPAHKPFQEAYWSYFRDLNTAWHDAQRFATCSLSTSWCLLTKTTAEVVADDDWSKHIGSAIIEVFPQMRG